MSHHIKMLIGCLLPIAMIVLLPLLGVSDSITVFIFFVLMFACHLGMMHKHGHHHGHRDGGHSDKGDSHGHA